MRCRTSSFSFLHHEGKIGDKASWKVAFSLPLHLTSSHPRKECRSAGKFRHFGDESTMYAEGPAPLHEKGLFNDEKGIVN